MIFRRTLYAVARLVERRPGRLEEVKIEDLLFYYARTLHEARHAAGLKEGERFFFAKYDLETELRG